MRIFLSRSLAPALECPTRNLDLYESLEYECHITDENTNDYIYRMTPTYSFDRASITWSLVGLVILRATHHLNCIYKLTGGDTTRSQLG